MRKALAGRRGITEKRMFGGVCFLLRGHMLCATGRNGFMFRVGKEQHSQALARGAAPVVLGGKGFQGFVWVDPAACDAHVLRGWIVRAQDYVSALLPKKRTGR
jgi:TfoX/Sxy family transcriptional regulator of competence genes